VTWSGAPDRPMCHRTVSGAPGPYNSELATFGFHKRRFAIIHRTVRCTSGAMTPSRNGRLQKLISGEQCANSARQSRAAVRGASDSEQYLSGAAPDCPVPLEDKGSYGRLRQNPNSWMTWLAHRTVRCAHRQQPPPTVVLVVEGYKYPQPPPLQPSQAFNTLHSIQDQSATLQDTNQRHRSDQSPQFNSIALGLVRRSLVFLVALVCLA
jgi:hypothetical protein